MLLLHRVHLKDVRDVSRNGCLLLKDMLIHSVDVHSLSTIIPRVCKWAQYVPKAQSAMLIRWTTLKHLSLQHDVKLLE